MKSPKSIERYRELKQQTPDYGLLMQVGVFMELMDEHAPTVVSVMRGLNWRKAGGLEDPVVVGGFPVSVKQSGLRWRPTGRQPGGFRGSVFAVAVDLCGKRG